MLEGIIGQKKVLTLSKEQILSIYKVCNNQEIIALTIGLNAGINREELVMITKDHVNLDAGTIFIRTEKKSRMVYLPPSAIERLRQPLKKLNGSVDPVVPFKNAHDFNLMYQKCSGCCDFQIEWQNIRHTYAELAAREGLPVKLVAHNIGVEEKTLNDHFGLTPSRIAQILKNKVIA